MADSRQKILVTRFSSLGDLIIMLPMLQALRTARPAAEIHLLTKERYAELFEGSPAIDRLILLRGGGAMELHRLRAALDRERYDIILDAHGVIRSRILSLRLEARTKASLEKDELRKLLLICVKLNRYRTIASQADRYMTLLAKIGIEADSRLPSLSPPPAAARKALSLISKARLEGRALVAVAPGARWDTKRWPASYYEELSLELSKRGYGVVFVGGPGDATAIRGIASGSFVLGGDTPGTRGTGEPERPEPVAPLDLTGRLTLLETAALLARCRLLVTNDSAPLHLAEAVGTPVVALYGPTVREFGYYPRLPESVALEVELRCRPCSRNGARACPYGTKECLTAVTPARVLAVVETLAGKPRRIP